MGSRRRARRRVARAAQGAPGLRPPAQGRTSTTLATGRSLDLGRTGLPPRPPRPVRGAWPTSPYRTTATPSSAIASCATRSTPAPTRAIELDCLACGACCKDNRVDPRRRRRRALREGGPRRSGEAALRQARGRLGHPRSAQGQALQAPGGRQQVRHLRHPSGRLQHVPRGQRVLSVGPRGGDGDCRRRELAARRTVAALRRAETLDLVKGRVVDDARARRARW